MSGRDSTHCRTQSEHSIPMRCTYSPEVAQGCLFSKHPQTCPEAHPASGTIGMGIQPRG
jgi:hypothetical protein